MSPLGALWQILNLFAVPALTGILAAAGAKLIWRQTLRGVPMLRLARDAVLAACLVTLAGLAITGRDGRMATYGAMLLACAITLWWRGFRRR